jgi:rhodanese-related sulfurtransferase
MRTLLLLSLLACSVTAGCSRDRSAADHAQAGGTVATVSTVSIDELDRMLASHECLAVDANGNDTRKKLGVIPGAVLLTNADSLDQLPADRTRNLVFYCTNTACGASHYAAEKAIAAGYTHVNVLPDGIAGWVKAGKKTSSI